MKLCNKHNAAMQAGITASIVESGKPCPEGEDFDGFMARVRAAFHEAFTAKIEEVEAAPQ